MKKLVLLFALLLGVAPLNAQLTSRPLAKAGVPDCTASRQGKSYEIKDARGFGDCDKDAAVGTSRSFCTCDDLVLIPHGSAAVYTAGGTIDAANLVVFNASGKIVEAGAAGAVVGVSIKGSTNNNPVGVLHSGVGILTAEIAVTAGNAIKASAAGQAMTLVDSVVSGAVIKTTGAGAAFGNQPANDGVEVISDDTDDTTQTLTVIGTTNGSDTVVVETVTLNGTTQVATVKTDWGVILAIKLSAAAEGTVTVREASANATITTLATTVLSKGVETVSTGTGAFNVIPTVVGSNTTTKQLGLKGTNAAGSVIYDSQALTNTTAAAVNTAFRTVTEVYTGDLEAARTATVAVGAAEDADLKIGYALTSASAGGAFSAVLE